ncbi:MAG: hypothetical protein ACM3PU_14570 [Gemmatimonadota bacterium]
MTRRSILVVAGLLVAGCATPPPVSVPREEPRIALPSREQKLERDFQARAHALMREERWADAEVQWKLLLLLRPDQVEYRHELEAARRHIVDIAAEANAHAAAARKRGDLDGATTQYLRALATDRDNEIAAQGLREIERERNRRAYLNRPPRLAPVVNAAKRSAPVELEPEYAQRQKTGNGEDASHPPRR